MMQDLSTCDLTGFLLRGINEPGDVSATSKVLT